jgi:hypothetical protein
MYAEYIHHIRTPKPTYAITLETHERVQRIEENLSP